jgi:hypothetical protein
MPFSYVVHNDLRLVVSTGYKRLSWSEIKRCQDLTQSDPDFNAQFDQIVDLRSVTGFAITAEQARMLAGRRIFSFTSKRAFVASNSAIFGMLQMWEAFAELSDNHSQIRVFHELSSALKWLRSEAGPTSIQSEPMRTEAGKGTSAELEES